MKINWIFFLISIVIAAYYSEGSTSPISLPVTVFEYATFQNAPVNSFASCKAFHGGLHHEPDTENGVPDYLQIDCDRYDRALACYRDVHNLPADAPPAETDLSTNARTQIESACAADDDDDDK